jgi:EAL domain-containing protein (putative c-di-GMP-specific phosphodiesterase class I)
MPGGAGWPSRHPPAVSVNVSAEQLRSFGLARIVASALARDGLPASRLVLEVTESTALAADAETQAALAALREFGVSLAVDDFGTGYSSLTYLARAPGRPAQAQPRVPRRDRRVAGPGPPRRRGDPSLHARSACR